MRHRRITGNGNVAFQAGYHYNSEFRRQIWLAESDCNNIRQWPPKSEIVISLELEHIASKLQRPVRDFWPWGARTKCRQVSATLTDNRKYSIFGTMTDGMTIPTEAKLTLGDCDNDRQPKWQQTFWVPILQFLVVDCCCNRLTNLANLAT